MSVITMIHESQWRQTKTKQTSRQFQPLLSRLIIKLNRLNCVITLPTMYLLSCISSNALTLQTYAMQKPQ
jgi:hypothetical protein